jgi:hypothetical protein
MTEIKKCPYCGEEILPVAKKCKHCGEWQNEYVSNKKTITKIGKYFRELSIIFTGIAITVVLGFWVNNKNNEKDLKQHLLAVKLELEEDLYFFNLNEKLLQKSVGYTKYLIENDKKALDKDSLDYYMSNDEEGYGIGFAFFPIDVFTTNAFEMLKSSGAMRQIKNKELLLSIWDAYNKIETAKTNLDRSFRRKEEELMKFAQQTIIEENQNAIPMQIFYECGFPAIMVKWCKDASEAIKETLSKFEEAGIK